MIIIADKIVTGGDCIGKINGKTVFIPQLLPGEEAEIEIIEQKKDYDRAKVINILNPSKHRIQPKCNYYGQCGGCNLQIADDEYQRELRLNILKDTFSRTFGRNLQEKLPALTQNDVIYSKSYNYRNRFQFHSGGLMSKSNNNVVKITKCLVAVPEVNELLKTGKIPQNDERIHVFNNIIAKEDKTEDSTCTCSIKNKSILFDARGFFQSNIEMLEKTIDLILLPSSNGKIFSGERLLDMYSGVGTLSMFTNGLFKCVDLVEHNKNALKYADLNLASIKHNNFPISGENWVSKFSNQKVKYDAVIIDPPRSGMEKSVISWLCNTKPHLIRSLSCDPVTHARDCKKLIEAGYSLINLKLLDYYPQTSHIESLAFLEYIQ